MRDYTKIKAWQLADDLTVAIYGATRSFPKDELYALTSQMRRSAYSVPANITEGASRHSQKDYLHFLYIARGSLKEASYFIHLATRLGYLSQAESLPLKEQADETSRTLTGLIRAVAKEVGVVRRTVARVTSLIILSMSTVSGLQSPVLS